MKFITFALEDQEDFVRWGVERENFALECFDPLSEFPSLLSFIEAGEPAMELLTERLNAESYTCYKVGDITIKAPYKPKKNIFCIGKNYTEHALEMSNQDPAAIPKYPVIFTKPATAVIGYQEAVESYAHLTEQLDYEGELAVIIGRHGKNITRDHALDYVFGYSILNDVTARDLQQLHQQFFKGKSLDSFAPFGPCIVHHSALDQPQNLQIKTYVNTELRQNGSTKDMIFSIAELIEVISQGMTLEPGDVIATGTPSGVGKGFNPPKFIRSGDTVRIEISQIGVLENPVR